MYDISMVPPWDQVQNLACLFHMEEFRKKKTEEQDALLPAGSSKSLMTLIKKINYLFSLFCFAQQRQLLISRAKKKVDYEVNGLWWTLSLPDNFCVIQTHLQALKRKKKRKSESFLYTLLYYKCDIKRRFNTDNFYYTSFMYLNRSSYLQMYIIT